LGKCKKYRFCRQNDTKVLRDLPFNLNQPFKSDDDWYIRIFKYAIKIHEYADIF